MPKIEAETATGVVAFEAAPNRRLVLAIEDAGIELADLDGIAVTQGPGLVGSLLVGVNTNGGSAMRRTIE